MIQTVAVGPRSGSGPTTACSPSRYNLEVEEEEGGGGAYVWFIVRARAHTHTHSPPPARAATPVFASMAHRYYSPSSAETNGSLLGGGEVQSRL